MFAHRVSTCFKNVFESIDIIFLAKLVRDVPKYILSNAYVSGKNRVRCGSSYSDFFSMGSGVKLGGNLVGQSECTTTTKKRLVVVLVR